MAFGRYQQPENYIAFSRLSDLQSGTKCPQTQTPRYFSSHPFFSLRQRELPQSLIAQKLRANESFARFFSPTMFPQRSPKRNKDVTFSTYPLLQNSLKYPSPRMSHLFSDEKLADFRLKNFESICDDKHGEMQQSEQSPDGASLSGPLPQALFPFRAQKRRTQAPNKCDTEVSWERNFA